MVEKEILCIVKASPFDDDKDDSFIVYSDYTYRCNHWEEGDFSEWRIVDGVFDVKHANDDKWQELSKDTSLREEANNIKLVEAVELALAVKNMVED